MPSAGSPRPPRQAWGPPFGPQFERLLGQPLGLGLVRGVEDRLDPLRDRLALVEAADIGLSVLLQMELAALPGNAGQGGPACGLEAGMIIRNDQFDAAQTATDEAVEECAPMALRFGQGHRPPKHPP